MRRTDQEFKAEVLRRSTVYRARQMQRRKKLLNAALCFVLVIGGFYMVRPFLAMGGSSEPAMENLAMPGAAADMEYAVPEAPEEAPEWTAAHSSIEGYGKQPETDRGLACGVGIVLTAEEEEAISGYLKGDWVEDFPDCAEDCTIILNGEPYRYHADCGTFRDLTNSRSLTVREEDRLVINAILEFYLEDP